MGPLAESRPIEELAIQYEDQLDPIWRIDGNLLISRTCLHNPGSVKPLLVRGASRKIADRYDSFS